MLTSMLVCKAKYYGSCIRIRNCFNDVINPVNRTCGYAVCIITSSYLLSLGTMEMETAICCINGQRMRLPKCIHYTCSSFPTCELHPEPPYLEFFACSHVSRLASKPSVRVPCSPRTLLSFTGKASQQQRLPPRPPPAHTQMVYSGSADCRLL